MTNYDLAVIYAGRAERYGGSQTRRGRRYWHYASLYYRRAGDQMADLAKLLGNGGDLPRRSPLYTVAA